MERATILSPPSTGLCGILLSVEQNITEGPEYEKISKLYRCMGERFYQLHIGTTTAVVTS